MNWPLVLNSLLVSVAATVLAVAGGLLAALWTAGLNLRWRTVFFAGAVIALAAPPFLVVNCWIDLLGDVGIWRPVLHWNIYGLGGTIWVLVLLTWPVSFFLVSAALRRVEPAQLEADPLLRGGALLRWLLLPMARTALLQAAILTMVLTLNNFSVPALLQVKVFPAEIWIRFNTTFDYVDALTLSWPLILGPLLLVLCFPRRVTAWSWRSDAATAPAFRRQLGEGWHWAGCGVALFLAVFSLGVPLWQLAGSAKTWREFAPALAAGQSAIGHSLSYAAVTACVVIIFGLLTWRLRLDEVLWLPFFTPGVLMGIGLIWAFNRPGLKHIYQSGFMVILAFTVRYAALGWTTVARAVRGTDRNLTDAARLEGATGWQMVRHVYWPQISAPIAAAWYVTYLLCLWDVETLVLIVPPGGESMALRVFNLLHYGHNSQVNALCLLLMVLAMLPLILWAGWKGMKGRWVSGAPHDRSYAAPNGAEKFVGKGFSTKMSRLAALTRQTESSHDLTRKGAPLSGSLPAGGERGKGRLGGSLALPVAVAVVLLTIGGCSEKDEKNISIQSKLFSSVQIIGTRGTGVGELNKPRGVAVDAQDNLYVVDMTGRVQKFSPDGVYILSWQMLQTDKGKPKGMCLDKDGNIVVIEPHYSRINHFTPEGKLVVQWGVEGTNAGQLGMPRGAVVDSHGNIYVCEYTKSERIQEFTAQGKKYLRGWGQLGDGPGEFSRAEGLGIDSKDQIYVADSCNHRIQIFSSDGKFLRAYGKAGSGVGEFSYPYDIRVDAQGRQYVCEFGNHRIQIFDANDQPLEILGGPGGDPGQFSEPWSIALDSKGNLYVADALNHRVQKFIRREPGA